MVAKLKEGILLGELIRVLRKLAQVLRDRDASADEIVHLEAEANVLPRKKLMAQEEELDDPVRHVVPELTSPGESITEKECNALVFCLWR